MRILRLAILLALTGTAASACAGPAAPGPTPTPIPVSPPTSTPVTPPPPTSTPLPTDTPTPSPSPTPAPRYADLEVINFEQGGYGVRMFLRLPGVSMPCEVMLGSLSYLCNLIEGYPDRLACAGSELPLPDKPMDLVFLAPGDRQELYRTTVTFPSGIYAVLIRDAGGASRPSWCGAIDTSTLKCTLECRVETDGPCVAASCRDQCGYAYSIHTCHENNQVRKCTAEEEEEQKARYGIP